MNRHIYNKKLKQLGCYVEHGGDIMLDGRTVAMSDFLVYPVRSSNGRYAKVRMNIYNYNGFRKLVVNNALRVKEQLEENNGK